MTKTVTELQECGAKIWIMQDVPNWRGLFGLPVGLKKLERRFPMLVKGGNLAIDGRLFGGQRFQGIDKLGVIVVEIRSVA